jgi:hypothetical protein
MSKTKDTIVAGVLAGWMGNIVKEIITWFFHFMGWVRYTFVHISAGFYYSTENIDSPLSLVTGVITDWTIAGTFGVVLLCLLRLTGSDYAVFKGIGLGALVFVITFGIGMAMDITRATLVTPLPDFLLLMSHIILGAITGWALGKYFTHSVVSSNISRKPTPENVTSFNINHVHSDRTVQLKKPKKLKKLKKIISLRSPTKKKK